MICRLREFFAEWRELVHIKKLLHQIKRNLEEVKKKMSALDDRLAAIETKLDEAAQEILAELATLRSENLSDEGRATLARVETKVTAMADISPPIPPPPP